MLSVTRLNLIEKLAYFSVGLSLLSSVGLTSNVPLSLTAAKPVVSFELSPLDLTKKKIVQASNNSLKELIFESLGDTLKCLNNLDRESAELGLLIADVQDFCTDRIEAGLKDSRTALNLLRCRDHDLLQACANSLIDLEAQATALAQELKRQRAALNTQFTQLKKSVDSDKLKKSSTN